MESMKKHLLCFGISWVMGLCFPVIVKPFTTQQISISIEKYGTGILLGLSDIVSVWKQIGNSISGPSLQILITLQDDLWISNFIKYM